MDTTNVTVSKLAPPFVKQSSSGDSSVSQALNKSSKTEGTFHHVINCNSVTYNLYSVWFLDGSCVLH